MFQSGHFWDKMAGSPNGQKSGWPDIRMARSPDGKPKDDQKSGSLMPRWPKVWMSRCMDSQMTIWLDGEMSGLSHGQMS